MAGGAGGGYAGDEWGGARNRSQWVFRAVLRIEIYESELIERGHYWRDKGEGDREVGTPGCAVEWTTVGFHVKLTRRSPNPWLCCWKVLVGGCYKAMSFDPNIWSSTRRPIVLTAQWQIRVWEVAWAGDLHSRVIRKSHPHPFIPQRESTGWGKRQA